MTDSARQNATISLTAHYTAQVWLRNGLSDARLRTSHGTALWYLLAPAMAASSQFGGPTLEDFLLARHALIDLRLAEALDGGWVSQVIEIAAGPVLYAEIRRPPRLYTCYGRSKWANESTCRFLCS